MRIQYILHADFELPGIIETWATQHQFVQKRCRPFARERLPDPREFDLLIVMGGPQTPLKPLDYPYLEEEIHLIQAAVKRGLPVLGFCLGAQLIGEALGAQTEKSPQKEVGVFQIELTAEGSRDPLLRGLTTKFNVVHWHNDMPGLTKEAQILAFSEGCPRQIIRYLPAVYGFQCHPEATRLNIEDMIHHCADDLKPGKFVQSQQNLLQSDFAPINQAMVHILENLMLEIMMKSPIA